MARYAKALSESQVGGVEIANNQIDKGQTPVCIAWPKLGKSRVVGDAANNQFNTNPR